MLARQPVAVQALLGAAGKTGGRVLCDDVPPRGAAGGRAVTELETKLALIRAALDAHGLAAVRLRGVDWFAWATCGGSSMVILTTETGVAEVVVTRDGAPVPP